MDWKAKIMGAKGKSGEALTKKNISVIEKLAGDGYTDAQLAKRMGISTSTFYEWKNKYSEFSDAIKRGKNIIVEAVENSLYTSAIGYQYDEVTREPLLNLLTGEPLLDEKGNQRMYITKIVTKHAAPNQTAQIFILKNLKPEAWNDRKKVLTEIVNNGDEDEI
jgi:hypothetical protein